MTSASIEKYCEEHSTSESPVLSALNRETHLTQVYPRMLSGHLQGLLLRFFSSMAGPAKILEIGTFTGYSSICLAEHPGSIVHTIEVNPELEPMIRKYLREAGIENRVILHVGDALQILEEFNAVWDLVFIDADKPNYLEYYRKVLPSLRKGGWILADNALWDGKVLDQRFSDKDTQGIRAFNDYVQADPSVENLLLPFRDGLMMIRKL
jgi:predicted O-methyltransferase YrrM